MHILIIGGGLSGLALAEMVHAHGAEFTLVEARDRVGGRILTQHHKGGDFDMGPAWFWPGQPRIAALIDRLGLTHFEQFATGALSYEDENGQVQRGRGYASMEGSLRVAGGLGAVTDALAARLPAGRVLLNTRITGLTHTAEGITATTQGAATLHADHVVLALPPRIAATMQFAPPLPQTAMQAMRSVPTWMAGQAKAVAVYNTPFWREAGLSGDAMSRHGPMVEIHDASSPKGGPYALFGFIGVPPQGRTEEQVLRQHLTAQLGRLFGPQASAPDALFVKDWAFDPLTSVETDKTPLRAHPAYGMPPALHGLWAGRLHMSGTEVAQQFGGFVEGALEAAETTFRALISELG